VVVESVSYSGLVAAERGLWDWVFDTAGAVAALAAIVGLFLVIVQLRGVKRQLVLANFDPTAQRMLDADVLLVQRPDLRKYVYGDANGMPVPPDFHAEDGPAALSLAEYFVDMLDTEMLRRRTFPIVSEHLPDFEPWLCDLLMQSVAACHVITQNSEWYSKDLLARFADLADRGMSAVVPRDAERAIWRSAACLSARWQEAVEHREPK
jgi:hypothetical protein